MPPQLLVTVLSFNRLARLPLFFRNTLEMPEACLIKPMIREKDCFNDSAILSDGDHREVLHIEINRHGDQVRILFARFDPSGRNLLDLREMQGRALPAQDQFGTLGFPGGVLPPLFKVAPQFDRIVVPWPPGPRLALKPPKPHPLLPSPAHSHPDP